MANRLKQRDRAGLVTFTLRYDEMRVFRVKVKNWTLFEVSTKNKGSIKGKDK